MKENILKLFAAGKTYNEIQKKLGCSKGTIAFHCSPEVKRKQLIRQNNDRQVARMMIREFKWRYKRFVGCKDCGEKDPVVLDFDHVRGDKSFQLANAPQFGHTLEPIKREIRKCEVRCANCHRRRTFKQFEFHDFK
jgi:hypothetical protein